MRGWTRLASLLMILVVILAGSNTLAQEPLINYTITIEQGEFVTTISPLQGFQNVVDYYNYTNFQANTGLEVIDRSLMFFYQSEASGLSLVVLHSRANGGAGTVNFDLTGLPAGFTYQVQDDADDQYIIDSQLGTTSASNTWQAGFSDGFAIGLGSEPTDFTATLTPDFLVGITEWAALTGDINTPETVLFPSLVEDLTISVSRGTSGGTPVQGEQFASFTVSPDQPGAGIPVQFNAQDSRPAPGRQIARYEWDFNGDGIFEVSTVSPVTTHTFSRTGTFTVRLRVVDNLGSQTTTSQSVQVVEVDARSVRTISTTEASPGSTFRVQLEISAGLALNGLGVKETLPPGFEIIPINASGSGTFNSATNEWIFAQFFEANEIIRITYDVRVSESASVGQLPKCFDIIGFAESASPGFLVNTTGESRMCLVDCLSPKVALAHLTPEDVVDLRMSNDLTADQIQRAASFWLEEAGVPGTCNAVISFEGLKELVAFHLSLTPVDENFAEELDQSINVTRSIQTPLPFGSLYLPNETGRVFRVQLDIEVLRDTIGAGIKEVIPSNWIIRPVDNGGAIFKRAKSEWVFTDRLMTGFDKRIVYEVVVPETESVGHLTLWGKGQAFIPRFEVSTPGDSEVWLVECLEPAMAIAHLDAVTNDIDVTMSNLIQFDQIQMALTFWLEDVPVPGTCGKSIDFETMKVLIAHWLTDTPVDQPLPGGSTLPNPAR